MGELVRRTQSDVWKLCHVLGSGGDVEDLVQETYLRAFGSLWSYRGEAPFRAWLLTIGRRTCADHVRRRQRERKLLERVRSTTPTDRDPGRDHTEDLLAVLEPDRRDAFVLTQLLDLSYEEAAEVLGCPVGTIRSRVARARAALAAATASPTLADASRGAVLTRDEGSAPRAHHATPIRRFADQPS